jgi:hypothetical protein
MTFRKDTDKEKRNAAIKALGLDEYWDNYEVDKIVGTMNYKQAAVDMIRSGYSISGSAKEELLERANLKIKKLTRMEQKEFYAFAQALSEFIYLRKMVHRVRLEDYEIIDDLKKYTHRYHKRVWADELRQLVEAPFQVGGLLSTNIKWKVSQDAERGRFDENENCIYVPKNLAVYIVLVDSALVLTYKHLIEIDSAGRANSGVDHRKWFPLTFPRFDDPADTYRIKCINNRMEIENRILVKEDTASITKGGRVFDYSIMEGESEKRVIRKKKDIIKDIL